MGRRRRGDSTDETLYVKTNTGLYVVETIKVKHSEAKGNYLYVGWYGKISGNTTMNLFRDNYENAKYVDYRLYLDVEEFDVSKYEESQYLR